MTIQQALREAAAQLAAAQIPDPAQDALLMLSHILHREPFSVRLDGMKELSPEDSARYRRCCSIGHSGSPCNTCLGSNGSTVCPSTWTTGC